MLLMGCMNGDFSGKSNDSSDQTPTPTHNTPQPSQTSTGGTSVSGSPTGGTTPTPNPNPVTPINSNIQLGTSDGGNAISGVPAYKVGVNFEDLFGTPRARKSPGVIDYNDAVLCFTGNFAVNPGSVISTSDQTVTGAITNRSACVHDLTITVTHPDGTKWSSGTFSDHAPPVLNMQFKVGSRLDVQMHPHGYCENKPVSMYDTNWSHVIVNQCNTSGN